MRSASTEPGHLIRRAKAHEAPLLGAMALRSKAYWGYSRAFIEACRNELTYTSEQLSSGRYDFFVAEIDAKVVGFFAVEHNGTLEAELEALFVEPEWIGHGLGRALMSYAKRIARLAGAHALLIQGDPHAEAFYTAAGGVRVADRESGSVPGRMLPVFRMDLGALEPNSPDRVD